MPLEGAYTIVNWLLKCTQCINDNIVGLMWRSVKDALHHQDKEAWKEVQKEAEEVSKEKAKKGRDHLQDSARRQHYREARDHDWEPSDSEKEVSRALSQVHIHSLASESSMALDTLEPKDG